MRLAAPARDLLAAARDLGSALGGAGSDTASGRGARVHRSLAAAGLALVASVATALAARALLPGPDPAIVWFGYEVHDRRWLVLGYWLGVASLVLVPLLAVRGRAWWSESSAGTGDRSPILRMVAALALYALWLGPPWHVERLARPMEWHELAHLGPIQALLAGKNFYLESGTQYGPGLQMLSVQYLEHFGVSLASFREFWLWMNFAGGLVIVAWLAWIFPMPAVLGGLWVLRSFSPFGFLSASEAGSYEFFYGWATCIRYAGSIHAALAVGSVLARVPPRGVWLTPSERLFLGACGLVWGWFALLAQENLGCGVAAIGLLAAFAAVTRAAPPGRLVAIGVAFGGGALVGAAPMLLLFVSAGALGAFAQRYFEIGGYVLSGFSSMPFDGSFRSPVGVLYLAAPVSAAALFAVAAFDGRRSRHWRVSAAAAAAAGLAGHAPALLRADEPHVLAMLAPLALVVAAAIAGLRQSGLRPASAPVLAFALLPVLIAVRPEQIARLGSDAAGRIAAFSAPVATAVDTGVAGRIGYRYDLAAPYSVFSSLPLGEFMDVSRRLHERVGVRPVVVASAIGSRGHWYFFADLVPLVPDPEPSMTIHNDRLRARYLAELGARAIPCVISTRPDDAEVALFRRQAGERDEWILETSTSPFFVGCLRSSAPPIAAEGHPAKPGRDAGQPRAAIQSGSSARSPIT